MKSSERITQVADQIEAVLKSNRLAIANPSALGQLRTLASRLSGVDNYAAEKAGTILEKAEIFYSARKHSKVRGGADELWRQMVDDLLSRIRQRAENRKHDGD